MINQPPSKGSLPVACVTGAAQGIGLATAKRLAQDGFHVVAIDRSRDQLEAEVATLVAQGLAAEAAALDICDRVAVIEALDRQPRVDAMVCAAGIYKDARLLELTDESFRRMLEVNVMGTFIPAQEAARRMRAGRRIVTVSSRGALGGTRFAHYVASKAAVVGLTRAMAMELRDAQIAVNSVAPGFTDTPMTRSAPEEMFSAWEQQEPSGKAASPDFIATPSPSCARRARSSSRARPCTWTVENRSAHWEFESQWARSPQRSPLCVKAVLGNVRVRELPSRSQRNAT
ncbi:SDR family NAD(P)-dependent oxidoreductase [Variovorax sp. J22R133]|uniref:SDR family NAD(P)-dependent oxidoreductase n=1 Tax=Variovorax brevis TaxID=3053503 RepID=UPI002575966A|nr:SDR family NAD(P)-dependent oxidoreductase [Variovorax sp. J22R133]MDM0116929.1 SDR family NAD(P)-dependent oxidoreductase [Variovorax sp. J22R133]